MARGIWVSRAYHCILLCGILLLYSIKSFPQNNPDTTSLFTLTQCIHYALVNQPSVVQSRIDEDISKYNRRISLSGWFPQLNVDANLQHYIQLPTFVIPDISNPSGPKLQLNSGVLNTSGFMFSADQTLYNTELLFSGKAVRDLRLQASQNTTSTRINTVVDVSKAFYDLLLTEQQSEVMEEDIQRLQRSYDDAYSLYKNGLTDKTDFQEAMILLNNAKAQKQSTDASLKTKYAVLKQVMGYPPEMRLRVSYDSASLEHDAFADTMEQLNYEKRIEYQQIETNLKLEEIQVKYYRWSFLPNISAFYDYNLIYQDDNFAALYTGNYPNSLVGIKLTLPIFQGNSRIYNLKKAGLQYKRLNAGKDYLKSQISSEYNQALASYSGNLYALSIAKSNSELATGIYNTVRLQYQQGIKDYLDVLVAETALRTARLNYLSTLFQLLSSKLDLKKSLGEININQ